MNVAPTRGMRDLLPKDVEIREHVTSIIEEVYKKYGFQKIETPALENIHLLSGGDGGENEKMLYKVLKRGEKLNWSEGSDVDDLVDLGLRFDLTVPLSRFYANNYGKLATPFKCLQIGSVWRAERPQRGRFRQFTQCDLDIIGEDSILAELELISATTQALLQMGFQGFNVKINDRRILTALASHAGIDRDDHDNVFITLDKIDKIGRQGVVEELVSRGTSPYSAAKLLDDLQQATDDPRSLSSLPGLEPHVPDALHSVIDTIAGLSSGAFKITFDPTLVRGMSYYTGLIFEVAAEGMESSIAGGGRYDKMISKLLGKHVPACGFSIGFERIVTILQEQGSLQRKKPDKIAILYDKHRISNAQFGSLLQFANELRADAAAAAVPKSKNFHNQLKRLLDDDFTHYAVFDGGSLSRASVKPIVES